MREPSRPRSALSVCSVPRPFVPSSRCRTPGTSSPSEEIGPVARRETSGIAPWSTRACATYLAPSEGRGCSRSAAGRLPRPIARPERRRRGDQDRPSGGIRTPRASEGASSPRRARFRLADAASLLFGTGLFYRVAANITLLEVRGARTATEEVARVLGEPGRFVFSISHPCFDADERSVGSIDRGRDARGVFPGRPVPKGRRRSCRTPTAHRVGSRAGPGRLDHRLSSHARYLPPLAARRRARDRASRGARPDAGDGWGEPAGPVSRRDPAAPGGGGARVPQT